MSWEDSPEIFYLNPPTPQKNKLGSEYTLWTKTVKKKKRDPQGSNPNSSNLNTRIESAETRDYYKVWGDSAGHESHPVGGRGPGSDSLRTPWPSVPGPPWLRSQILSKRKQDKKPETQSRAHFFAFPPSGFPVPVHSGEAGYPRPSPKPSCPTTEGQLHFRETASHYEHIETATSQGWGERGWRAEARGEPPPTAARAPLPTSPSHFRL